MNRFVPGLRLLLCGVVLLAIALMPLAVSAQGTNVRPIRVGTKKDDYLISPKKLNNKELESQLNFFSKGTAISRDIHFYPNIFAPYNLAYSRDELAWHSRYFIKIHDKKDLRWSVDFSADGQLSENHSAFRDKYRKVINEKGKEVFTNTSLWKVGYPHIQYSPRNLKIFDGKKKNFRSTWHYEVRPGRGRARDRRWQVMYEIKLGVYDKDNNVQKPVWIQIELIKQGHGEPKGRVVEIPGNKFSKWRLGDFGSTWTKAGDKIPVFRFSHVRSYDPIGVRKSQKLEIDFFPFLQYCAVRKIFGITWNHQIIDVNAGIEIGRGGRGTKFITSKYGIGVLDKEETNSSGSPASATQKKSRQLAAMREQETRVPSAVGAL